MGPFAALAFGRGGLSGIPRVQMAFESVIPIPAKQRTGLDIPVPQAIWNRCLHRSKPVAAGVRTPTRGTRAAYYLPDRSRTNLGSSIYAAGEFSAGTVSGGENVMIASQRKTFAMCPAHPRNRILVPGGSSARFMLQYRCAKRRFPMQEHPR